MALKFTKAAEADLLDIIVTGILEHGQAQAARYQAKLKHSLEFITANPLAVRERTEITPPVRVHPSGVHVIVFRMEGDEDVLVIRVRHGREDWASDPSAEDGAT